MSTLKNKIDFALLVSVTNANPNGDPLNGNRPRTDYSGFGEMSDVCIKRKIRNRLQDLGMRVFVQSNDRCDDEYKSLSERASNTIIDIKTQDDYAKKACETWFDVRAFGQVFAFKSNKEIKEVSVGVRGPVSIHQAVSYSPIDINSMQITKSVNSEPTPEGKKSSDTMGTKHFVSFGLYKIKGSINVQLAEKTNFSDEDSEVVKECLKTLFQNDASSARPEGSMEVCKLYWWKHNCKDGQYSSAKVHRLLNVKVKDEVQYPTKFNDYEVSLEELPNLTVEIFDGI